MTEKKLDPIVSEFETEEQAAEYDRWFRAKVQAALDDLRPGVPHEEVMARMDAVIAAARRKRGVPDPGKLDPIVSEFATEEEAADYDRWFRAQVQAAIDDPRPDVSHEQVMAETEAIIVAAETRARKKA